MRISSRQHPVIARLRALANRPEPQAVLLDGDHLIADAMTAGVPLEVIVGGPDAAPLLARAKAAGVQIFEGSPSVLRAARPVQAVAGGAVAIARWAPLPLEPVLSTSPSFVLGLVDVQDPGNVGSAIRSADALDASAVIVTGESANPSGWKVLRGSMGSAFRLPVGRGASMDALTLARRHGLTVVATTADGGTALDQADLSGPILLLVGNEGAGLARALINQADRRVTIPMRHGVNSLNVSVTAAIVLWARRQQRLLQLQVAR